MDFFSISLFLSLPYRRLITRSVRKPVATRVHWSSVLSQSPGGTKSSTVAVVATSLWTAKRPIAIDFRKFKGSFDKCVFCYISKQEVGVIAILNVPHIYGLQLIVYLIWNSLPFAQGNRFSKYIEEINKKPIRSPSLRLRYGKRDPPTYNNEVRVFTNANAWYSLKDFVFIW